jgi:hypothetical protein
MAKVEYSVIPRFTVRRKGKVLDIADIERQFTEWIKTYTDRGLIISRNTTISAILEPGCLARILLQKKVDFVDFAALEFQAAPEKVAYEYRIAPIFSVKAKRLKSKEKKKVDAFDRGLAMFENQRDEFEIMINDYVNDLANKDLHYNSSTMINVAVEPGCLGMLVGKRVEYIDLEAYEFIKATGKKNYKVKIFPRFKCKSGKFGFSELEKDINDRVNSELQGGFELVGKIICYGFLETGCFGKGEMVSIDAFIFIKG